MLKKAVFTVLLIIVIFVAMSSQHKLIKDVKENDLYRDSLYIPSPQYVKVMAIGYDMIFSDVLWLRSIQAYGGRSKTFEEELPILENYFNVVTELDPHFINVYIFANMVLGEEAKDYEGALKLLDKGIKNNPDNYRPSFEAGYLCWWDMKDAKKAKEYYIISSKCPDAPDWVERQIAYFDLEMGQYQAAFEKWIETFLKAYDDQQDYLIKMNLDQIKKVINSWNTKILKDALALYKQENKTPLNDIKTLYEGGYIKKYTVPDYYRFASIIDDLYEKNDKNIQNMDMVIAGSMVTSDRIPNSPYIEEQDYYLYLESEDNISQKKLLDEYYTKTLAIIRAKIEAYNKKFFYYPRDITEIRKYINIMPEPLKGLWLYNPITGDFRSSVYPKY